MNSTIRGSGRRGRALAFAAALLCGLASPLAAEVHVEGRASAVRVTTSQDAIADVLAALSARFNVQYRSSIPLDAAAHADYGGSVAQVIARLLDGYNYVIKREQETMVIVVFGQRGEVAIPPTAPKPTTPSVASRWR